MKDLPPFTNHLRFNPWNSASTGHQVARSGGSNTRWHTVREQRLAQQFTREIGPRRRPSGEWTLVSDERDAGQRDIRSMFAVSKGSSPSIVASKGIPSSKGEVQSESGKIPNIPPRRTIPPTEKDKDDSHNGNKDTAPAPAPRTETKAAVQEKDTPKNIFRGTTIYLNSPSHPLYSDHKLKHLLTTHGAVLALSLTRRVSHVIAGRPNSGPGQGNGGGLAAGKLQKEINRAGRRAIKVVFVEWVIDSIQAGKRLPESRFAMHVAPQGQRGLSWGSP